MRLLLFDVDGTLVRVDGAGREALRAAMEAVYGETGPIDAWDFHGRTDPEIVRGLLRAAGRDDAWIERGFPRLWPTYGEALGRELDARRASLRLCPGVAELMAALGERPEFLTGLLTGNIEEGARRKLRACGLAERFPFGAFGSDFERRERLPAVALERAGAWAGRPFAAGDAVVIGDTPADIRCARAGGLRCLAVATGRHGPDELATHRPDALLPDLSDLDGFLTGVAGP